MKNWPEPKKAKNADRQAKKSSNYDFVPWLEPWISNRIFKIVENLWKAFDMFFVQSSIIIDELVSTKEEFDKLRKDLSEYLVIGSSSTMSQLFSTLFEFTMNVDTAYEEYQRIIRQGWQIKQVVGILSFEIFRQKPIYR